MGVIRAWKVNQKLTALALGLWSTSVLVTPSFALPQGDQVRAGSAVVTRGGQGMRIDQLTDRAIIDWQAFSISANEIVQFVQPGRMSAVLNRVTGIDPSVINGILQGNGSIFLVNPNGVLIGTAGSVNAGSFLATTLDTTNAEFLSGQMTFKPVAGRDLAAVINHGTLRAEGGFVVLMAPSVATDGAILARGGEVRLGAGKQATINFDGQNLISFAMDSSPFPSQGTLVMSRADANQVLAQSVRDFGVAEAGSLYVGGTVDSPKVSLQAGSGATLAGVTRTDDLNLVVTDGDANLNSAFALDGHNLSVEASGDITFDTLVAEAQNGQGGLVRLVAGDSITMNKGGQGLAGDRVELTAQQGDISTNVSANRVSALAPHGDISLDLYPGLIDAGSGDVHVVPQSLPGATPSANGTLVGQWGTVVDAHAGGDVSVTSENTIYVGQISGRNVGVQSRTGSVVDAGDDHESDPLDIVARESADLSAAGFLGTVDNPLEIRVGGNLGVYAGSEIDGISGVLIGDVGGHYAQSDDTAGLVLLNPGDGFTSGLSQALHGVMDNALTGESLLGGSDQTKLFYLQLVNSIDEEQWLRILRRTVIWEDSPDEATPDDL